MELGTLLVGAIMVWRYRYPFLLMPVAATLWYMSMDIAELLTGDIVGFTERARITMWFGLVITLLALRVDIRSRFSLDYAFWLYLFGVTALWGGQISQQSDSEIAMFIQFCVNLLLIVVGVVLARARAAPAYRVFNPSCPVRPGVLNPREASSRGTRWAPGAAV